MFRICCLFCINMILKALLYYIFLPRYAFLYYTDDEEAVKIVQNSDKFKINDQSLSVSLFDSIKSASRRREQVNYVRYPSDYFENSP